MTRTQIMSIEPYGDCEVLYREDFKSVTPITPNDSPEQWGYIIEAVLCDGKPVEFDEQEVEEFITDLEYEIY